MRGVISMSQNLPQGIRESKPNPQIFTFILVFLLFFPKHPGRRGNLWYLFFGNVNDCVRHSRLRSIFKPNPAWRRPPPREPFIFSQPPHEARAMVPPLPFAVVSG
jgi:hypothetical protein